MSKIKKYSLISILSSLFAFIYVIITNAKGMPVPLYGPALPSPSQIGWIVARLAGVILVVIAAPITGIAWYLSRKKHKRWFVSVIWSIVYLIILATIIFLLVIFRS